jgi:hypothetical protein
MELFTFFRIAIEEERSQAKVREEDYHDKIDGLDKEIFTLTECVEVSESHAEELQNELMKERARTGNTMDSYCCHKTSW